MAHRHLAAVAAAMQAPAVRSVLRSIDFGLRLRGCKQQPVFNSGLPAGGRRAHSNVSARPDPPSQDDEKAVWYSEVHLKVLGLSQGATKRDIKQAYLKLVKELHPDRRHHQDEAGKAAAQAEFIAVQEAFSKLMGRKEQVNTGSGFHSHTDRNPYTEHHPVWTYMGGSIVIGTVLFFVVVQWWNSGVSDGTAVNKQLLRLQERGTQDRKKRLQEALNES